LEDFHCYNGDVITKELAINSFHKLDIDLNCQIILLNGTVQKVVIEGKEDMIKDVESRSIVTDDTWIVRSKSNCTLPKRESKLYITVPGLNEISIDGDFILSSDEFLKNINKILKIDLDGNGDVSVMIDSLTLLELNMDGNCKAELIGRTKRFDIYSDGNSVVKAHDLVSEITNLEIDGNVTANVQVLHKLFIKIDGNATVCYKGNPQIISNQNGSSKIKNCN